MTRNEKIAEKMGWSIWQKTSSGPFPKILYHINNANGYSLYSEYHQFDFNVNCSLEIAHLLIERMRQDGWHVHASFISDQQVHLGAFDTKLQKWEFADKPDFPTAVVELFCKVYGIRED